MTKEIKGNLVSIIVPIYKVEDYLARCIDSLINQTYKNIEIILVNDGSPDSCGRICNEYAQIDSRIVVIHKENGGLSDARNVGIKSSRGEYVTFVDSDDWVSPYYIEYLYNILIETNSCIVECDYLVTERLSDYEHQKLSKIARSSYAVENALELLIKDRVFKQVVWNKMYKKEVLKNVSFELGKTNEDEFWTYQIFGNALKITKLNEILYFYFQRPGSIMRNRYSLKRLDAIEAKSQRQAYIDQRYQSLSDIAATNFFGTIIYSGQMTLLYLDPKDKIVAFIILEEELHNLLKSHKYCLGTDLKEKLWFTLAKMDLKIACFLRNTLKINVK